MKLNFIKVPFLLGLMCLASCQNDEVEKKIVEKPVQKEVIKEVPKVIEPTKLTITAAEISSNGVEMFTDADNEVKDGTVILYNDDLRSFKINQMLEIKPIAGNKFRIRNFLPHTFKDLSILLTIKGLDAPIKLGSVAEIPAFYFYEGELPLAEGEVFFEDVNGKKISLERFKRLALSDMKLSFEGNDPMLEKINKIDVDIHYILSHDYKQPGKWDRPTPDDVRRYIPFLSNMWYVFCSEKFKHNLYNYRYEFRHGWKAGLTAEEMKVHKDTHPWTEAREEQHNVVTPDEIYSRLREKRPQRLGMIVQNGVNGLGGYPATFGIHRWIMKGTFGSTKNIFFGTDIDYAKSSYLRQPMEAFVHEFGHVMNYGHTGNMTYSYDYNDTVSKGFVPLFAETYREMQLEKDLPFMDYPYNN